MSFLSAVPESTMRAAVQLADSFKLSTLARKSGNVKLGDAAASYAPRESCPDSCRFKASGECYGNGYYTSRVWNKISGFLAEVSEDVRALAAALSEAAAVADVAKPSRDLRLHVVGDAITAAAAEVLASAAQGYRDRAAAVGRVVRVWSYTHAWRVVPRAAWGSVSVLASCETSADVAQAWAAGYTPARVVGEFPNGGKVFVVDGQRYLPCGEQSGAMPDCVSCGWCMDDAKLRRQGLAIAFAAHGNKVKAMRASYAV